MYSICFHSVPVSVLAKSFTSPGHREQLAVVTKAVIILRILYALPARGGFLSVELHRKIDTSSNV